jgi:hypothetical protein
MTTEKQPALNRASIKKCGKRNNFEIAIDMLLRLE